MIPHPFNKEGIILFLLGASLLALLRVWKKLLTSYFSPIHRLRGPPANWVTGNFDDISAENTPLTLKWSEEYGHNFRIRGLFMTSLLYTTDTRVINHALTHSMDYYKPPDSRRNLARILGKGVLVMEGERHRQQRRVMNPAFGPAQIRELTEIFLERSMKLCDYWKAQIGTRNEAGRINVMDGLSKMTLDVIGLAGFNYEFDALNIDKPPNELNQVFNQIFKKPPELNLVTIIKQFVPGLSSYDVRTRQVDQAQAAMQRIARQLMQERKAEIMHEHSGVIEKMNVQGRDLLTLLIKANMATDIPDNQRMTDEEVLAQVPTFLVAGHETTSTATTWCLYALCQAPHIQDKLREELLSVSTNTPSMDDLMELPYLDQVVRETLRLHAPVTLTSRVVQRDDVIPVSDPFKDKYGNVVHELELKAGDRMIIPIIALNRSKTLWGEDANEFKPERWDNPPEAASSVPGVWGHLLTFLGGPHACIGYRFSLVEMKGLIFTLIRTFEFIAAFAPEDMRTLGTFIQRPSLHSETDKGAQLPLRIRPYIRAQ